MLQAWGQTFMNLMLAPFLATAALGVAAIAARDHSDLALQLKYLSAPMIIAGIGGASLHFGNLSCPNKRGGINERVDGDPLT